MANERNRTRFSVRGLGLMELREIYPNAETDRTDIGYLEATAIDDLTTEVDLFDERGDLTNVFEQDTKTIVRTALQQVGIDEYDLIRNSRGKLFALNYAGKVQDDRRWQYFGFDQVRLSRSVLRGFKQGAQTIPFAASVLDLKDELGHDHPLYYLYEGACSIRTKNLNLWIDPRLGHNAAGSKVLDISGFARHGTLNSDYAVIWQAGTTPARFLRFDGVNDGLNFGNILNDDGSGDFMIDFWFRIPAANGTLQELLAKKTATGTSAGFGLYRQADNTILFQFASGSANADVISESTVLQNVWKHGAVAVDRDGNAQLYLNGVADGSPVSVAAIGTGTNALNLYGGRDNTNFGQVDLGTIRIYRFAAGGLPANAAAIIAEHFNGEREFYGL